MLSGPSKLVSTRDNNITKQAKAAVDTTKAVYRLTKKQYFKTRQQPNLGRD
jgi:hypothetical protein